MQTLDQIPLVKKQERSHTARQFLRWNKYWMNCKDPKMREAYFKQANILGHMLEEELLKQRD